MEGQNQPPHAEALLKRALKRARGSILWERLWPVLMTLATAVGVFLALSWAGLWLALPPLARIIGVALFALIVFAAAVPLLLLRVPTIYDALRRLDRNSGERHRPATAIADDIAANGSDPVAQALWRAHVERALLSARRLKAGWPSPRLALRDPMAFRALILFLVVASFFAASGERVKRIAAAFDWDGVVAAANYRIDAWVNPPVYTGRAPVMLQGLRPGQQVAANDAPISVPAGSQLVVRATGKVKFDVGIKGGLEAAKTPPAPLPQGVEERRYVINGDGSATVQGGGRDLAWNFTAIPDRVPVVELIRDPERLARGALRLDYRLEDDYGVIGGEAAFTPKPSEQQQGQESPKPPRPLYDAPKFNLSMPQSRTRAGTGQTTHDLTEHPWSGSDVMLTLTVRDEAGNEGKSEPREVTLPQRLFFKPLARALVEQRRILALDANAAPVVGEALDALTIAPDKFIPETSIYLGLRSIYYDLANAKTDDNLREVVARLWDMAVHIEDGNMSDVEKQLRAAQDALKEALERGASDEEIRKLMNDLRAALDKFLQALAEQMQKNPQQLARPLDRNTKMLNSQDLKNMLDRMEQMARSGDRDAAKRMLEQLQSMLENLQMAQPNGDMNDDDDMMSSLDELGDMIRKQQQLRDKTYKQGQDQRRDRRRGQQGDRQMGDLQQDQQALRDRLNKLLDQLKKRGMGDPQMGQNGQKGQKGQQRGERGQSPGDQLGEAGDAMGDAESQLGEGDADGAVDSQGRALEALRKGAQGMAQAMQQQEGQGPGQVGRPGRGQRRAQQDTDPLGRPMRGREYGDDTTVKVPGEIDAQRARRVLEELRRRYSDPQRPQMELDYIERLLKGF
ncbi:MAG TPA: TIGR02302 family protein [Pseudolabrys sp.]|nr:TIGR02302 family protein [Pseudolabrys sp.]